MSISSNFLFYLRISRNIFIVNWYFQLHHVLMHTTHVACCRYNSHNLTIVFAGGLGNQMFQYSALYGISKANGFRPLLCGQTVIGL